MVSQASPYSFEGREHEEPLELDSVIFIGCVALNKTFFGLWSKG